MIDTSFKAAFQSLDTFSFEAYKKLQKLSRHFYLINFRLRLFPLRSYWSWSRSHHSYRKHWSYWNYPCRISSYPSHSWSMAHCSRALHQSWSHSFDYPWSSCWWSLGLIYGNGLGGSHCQRSISRHEKFKKYGYHWFCLGLWPRNSWVFYSTPASHGSPGFRPSLGCASKARNVCRSFCCLCIG